MTDLHPTMPFRNAFSALINVQFLPEALNIQIGVQQAISYGLG